MPPKLALLLTVLFILWLLLGDLKRRSHVSHALWLPLLWLVIFGSKPITLWFGLGGAGDDANVQIDGSPVDRLFYLALIIAGAVILARRHVTIGNFIANNKLLFVFYLYLGISVLWSDYSFVSFKRWVKDAGGVVIALVILTEDNPIEAVKAALLRCTYVLVPLSVLFIKYFPDIGRYYNRWTYEPAFCGVTTDKNLLGMTLLVFSLVQLWNLLELWESKAHLLEKTAFYANLAVALMTGWLLLKSNSMTALVCSLLGGGILVGTRFPALRNRVSNFWTYGLGIVVLYFVLQSTFDLGTGFAKLLGRNPTLTGRTEIWQALFQVNINPLIGTGYYSFWMGDRSEQLFKQYYYRMNEAHNGYLETYLNSGLIGLGLLLGVLISAINRAKDEVLSGSNFGALRLAFMSAILIYGMTEAVFRFGLLWFVLLVLIMQYPVVNSVPVQNQDNRLDETLDDLEPAN
jgi:exopolysaccharide production protein ExoQ